MNYSDISRQIPVIIPAYEPNHKLIKLCKDLTSVGINNIVVVDDGSGDKYQDIFTNIKSNFGVTLIKHSVNMGKGRGLKNAFNEIINQQKEVIACVTVDSDGQHTPKDIINVMHACLENPNSLVLGVRDFSGDHIPFKSRWGNSITKVVSAFILGEKITDTQTGLRGIPVNFMRDLQNVFGERFEFEMNMLVEAVGSYQIIEIPIETVYESKDNHATHFNPVTDSIKIYKVLGKVFLKYIFSAFSSSILDLTLFAILSVALQNIISHPWNLTLATILARIVSSIYNYLINKNVVFNNEEHVIGRYITLVIITMLTSAGLVSGISYLVPGVSPNVIKLFVDTVLFFMNYYIQKKYVFND